MKITPHDTSKQLIPLITLDYYSWLKSTHDTNSHLNYGILVWGYQCYRLEKIQKRIIRTITVSKYNAHTEPLFKLLGLLKIQDMLDLSSLKFYYRYRRDNLPAFFYTFKLTTHGSQHQYNTRHREQMLIDRTRTNYADRRICFSQNLTKYFIHRYSDICYIVNCYVCRHVT